MQYNDFSAVRRFLVQEIFIIKIVDSHSNLYIFQCLCCFRLSYPASFFQDFEYFRKLLLPFFSSCTDWCQLCLKNLVQEFLHFDITQTSTLIVRFQFIQILIFRPEFFEIFILAECIQINEYRIAFYLSRIFHAQVVRICEHGHYFLLNNIFFIRKIDTVSK